VKKYKFFHLLYIFILLSLGLNQMYAKSISWNLENPASFSYKKDMEVKELKVTGNINKKTLSALLYLYPNLENLDLLNSKILAYTDENKIRFEKNELPSSIFNKKEKLKSVILPSGLTKIGIGAFWNCSGLERIVLPPTIQVIDRFAFQLCIKLKSITFPENLESIGGATFASCSALTTIYCLSKTPPKMKEWNPFTDIKSTDCILYVPKKSISNYQKTPFLNSFVILALK